MEHCFILPHLLGEDALKYVSLGKPQLCLSLWWKGAPESHHGRPELDTCMGWHLRRNISSKNLDIAVIWWCQNGLCILKLNLLGASITLNFNGPNRTESDKNEKSNILTPDYKQINPTLFHTSTLDSFKKSQIYTPDFSFEKHLNKYWNSQK